MHLPCVLAIAGGANGVTLKLANSADEVNLRVRQR